MPEWFPGAGWKRWILVLRDRLIKMRNVPYDITKAAVVSRVHTPLNGIIGYIETLSLRKLSGDTTPTFVSSMMEDTQADEVTKKWISATACTQLPFVPFTRYIHIMSLFSRWYRR